jgi:hypothetical protein
MGVYRSRRSQKTWVFIGHDGLRRHGCLSVTTVSEDMGVYQARRSQKTWVFIGHDGLRRHGCLSVKLHMTLLLFSLVRPVVREFSSLRNYTVHRIVK